jgi:hypothetical protein
VVGSASWRIGVAVAVATTTTAATAPSGALESCLAFPVPPAISDSYEMIIHRNFRVPQEPPAKLHTAGQAILASGMLSPLMAAEGGSTLLLVPDIPLFIVEERPHGWATVYCGTATSAGSVEIFGEAGGRDACVAARVFAGGGHRRSPSSRSSPHCRLERSSF